MKPGRKNGVVIHLLPLNELVKDKTADSNIKAGYILMNGEARMMDSGSPPPTS